MNALDRVREIIKAKSSKAKLFGFGDELSAVLDAVNEIERRVGVCAEAWLLLYEHMRNGSDVMTPKVHGALIASLGNMNDHAKIIARRIEHGRRCTCSECMK